MNEEVNLWDLEDRMLEMVSALETATDEYGTLLEAFSEAEVEHKRKWANAYLRTEGSVKFREVTADTAALSTFAMKSRAEARMKAKREKLSSLRTILDSLRTLSANVRIQK